MWRLPSPSRSKLNIIKRERRQKPNEFSYYFGQGFNEKRKKKKKGCRHSINSMKALLSLKFSLMLRLSSKTK